MARRRRRRRRRVRLAWYEILAIVAFGCVFLVSAAMLINYFLTASREQSEFDDLSKLVHKPAASQSAASAGGEAGDTAAEEELDLDQLFELNPDTFGWVTIRNTRLDYPVMHTPAEPEKYLRKSFYGAYADSGVPFLEAQCTADSANLIIYGHNMKSGSMFHALEGYLDASYFAAHPTISLTTAGGETLYDVMAVLHFQVTADTIASYYAIPATAEQFEAYVDAVRGASVYDTHINAEWGTQLLTLSTCDNVTDDGRILVVARAQAAQS